MRICAQAIPMRACKESGGTVRGGRGNGDVIASIDNCKVIDYSGKLHTCTVRRVDCEMLSENSKCTPYLLRCRSCQSLRETLRSIVSCQSNESDNHTSPTSRTKHNHLSSTKKDARLKNLHRALKRLQAKVDRMIADKAIRLQDSDSADISHIVTGFVDLGRCNQDMEQVVHGDKE